MTNKQLKSKTKAELIDTINVLLHEAEILKRENAEDKEMLQKAVIYWKQMAEHYKNQVPWT